jgi:hypothetical protein
VKSEATEVVIARTLGPLLLLGLVLIWTSPTGLSWAQRCWEQLRWRVRRALWRRWWRSLAGWQQEIVEQIHGPQGD